MKPTDRDKLLALFRRAGDSPPDSAHVATDDDLLTAWRLGTIAPPEEDRFFSHLASCSTCRKSIVELADLLPAEESPVTAVAGALPPSRRHRLIWTAAVAVAACLVIGLAWMFNSPADSTEIARAQRALNEGRTEEALVWLSGIRPERLRTEAERVEFRRMQEEATFRAAFADLKAGRDDDAAAHCLAARARGVDSPRLAKLYRLATTNPATRGQEWEKELLEESAAEKP